MKKLNEIIFKIDFVVFEFIRYKITNKIIIIITNK